MKISDFKSKKVLIVFPHPDDDTFTIGGLLQLFEQNNVEYNVLTLTKGGAGKSCIDLEGKNISEVREGEYRKALNQMRLKLSHFHLLDFEDGKLIETTTEIENFLAMYMDNVKPDILITYDNSGMTGHPDHIIISKILFELAKSKDVDLYFFAVNFLEKLYNMSSKTKDNFQKITDQIAVPFNFRVNQYKALLDHKSQFGTLKYRIIFLMFLLFRSDSFHKVDFTREYKFRFEQFDI